MRKTKLITLGILAATAMACDEQANSSTEEAKHCVDSEGIVVDEALCRPLDGDGGSSVSIDDAGIPIVVSPANNNAAPIIFYRYYYGGSHIYAPGTRIITSGGGWSFRPSVGHSYSSPSTFSKGGFGSAGRSFSTGGGAGE